MSIHWIYIQDYDVEEHPFAVFDPFHLNTKGLIFTIIVSTHRHNLPSEGGLQMLSDIWKTNYLAKEEPINENNTKEIIQRAACHALYTSGILLSL